MVFYLVLVQLAVTWRPRISGSECSKRPILHPGPGPLGEPGTGSSGTAGGGVPVARPVPAGDAARAWGPWGGDVEGLRGDWDEEVAWYH